MNGDTHLVARGVLNWNREERITDRYGAVHFNASRPDWGKDFAGNAVEDLGAEVECLNEDSALVGRRGRLHALVVEARDSGHIGDFFRGVGPTRPEVGELVLLGEGTLFVEPREEDMGSPAIGLRPVDGRESDWLDIRALYRCHEQTVEVYFEEKS